MTWADGLVVDGRIDPAEWRRLWNAGAPVGICDDGGLLLVVGDCSPVETMGATDWYTCRCTGCGRETTAPDGRLAPVRRRGRPMPAYVRELVRA